MKSNNGKRLVAAVAIFAMLVCALAAIMPGADAQETTDGTASVISNAAAYEYPEDTPYEYVGVMTIDGNDVVMTYDKDNSKMAKNLMNDFARFMGALYYANENAEVKVESITYSEKDYTWNTAGTLKGSNWVDTTANNATLVSVVTDDAESAVGEGQTGSFNFTLNLSDETTVAMTFGLAVADILDGTAVTDPMTVTGDLLVTKDTTVTVTLDGTNTAAISMADGAKITVLEGATLTVNAQANGAERTSAVYGIYGAGDLTIDGPGKVAVNMTKSETDADQVVTGIGAPTGNAGNTVTINTDVTIYSNVGADKTAQDNKSYGINATSVEFNDSESGIYAGNRAIYMTKDVTLTDSTVTVGAYERGIRGSSEAYSVVDVNNSKLTAVLIDGEGVNDQGGDDRFGIKVGKIDIDATSEVTTDGLRLFADGSTVAGKLSVAYDAGAGAPAIGIPGGLVIIESDDGDGSDIGTAGFSTLTLDVTEKGSVVIAAGNTIAGTISSGENTATFGKVTGSGDDTTYEKSPYTIAAVTVGTQGATFTVGSLNIDGAFGGDAGIVLDGDNELSGDYDAPVTLKDGATAVVPEGEEANFENLTIETGAKAHFNGKVGGNITGNYTYGATADVTGITGGTPTKISELLQGGAITSGENWTYDAATNTLTLNGGVINGYFTVPHGSYALTVNVVKNTTIVVSSEAAAESGFTAAIFADNSVVINGPGALTIDAAADTVAIQTAYAVTITAGAYVDASDLTLKALTAGRVDDKITVNGDLAIGTVDGATVVIGGNLNAGSVNGAVTVNDNSTLVVGTLTATGYDNKGIIVVTEKLDIQVTQDTTLPVYMGMPMNAGDGIYFLGSGTNVKVAGNWTSVNVESVTADVITNIATEEVLQEGNVLIVAFEANFNGLEVVNTVTVTGTVTGDFTVTGKLTAGTVNGTINGVKFENLVGAVVTGDANSAAVIAQSGTAAITGTATLDGKGVLAVAEGAVFNGTVNGTVMNVTAGAGFQFDVVDVGTQDAPEEVIGISGDFTANAAMTVTDLVIENAVISAKNPVTITVNGTLTMQGNVEIGKNVTVNVGSTATLDASEATVAGGKGCITLEMGGNIIGVPAELVVANGTFEVKTPEDFITAIGYYSNIKVANSFELTSEKAVSYDVTGKTITVAENAVITVGQNVTLNFVNTTLTVEGAGNATAIAVKGAVDIANSYIYSNVDIVEYEIEVDAETTQKAEGTVTVSAPVVMNVSGASASPLNKDVAYGNILNLENYDVKDSQFAVYGVVNVAGTVTLSSNVAIQMYDSGVMNVNGDLSIAEDNKVEGTGTVNVIGTMTVAGTFNGKTDITGTLTVAETGTYTGTAAVSGTLNVDGTYSGDIANKGTVVFNGTSGDAVITAYAGSTNTIASVTGKLTVTDLNTVDDFKPAKDKTLPAGFSQDGNSIVLENVAGISVTVSTQTADGEYTDGTAFKYAESVMDVSGDVALAAEQTAGKVTIASVTGLTLEQTLDLAEGIALEMSGTIEVAGSISAYDVSLVAGSELTVTGDVSVVGATVGVAAIETNGAVVNATYYTVSTAAAREAAAYVTGYYTTFDKALDAIASADQTTITVNGEQTSTMDRTVTGTVVVPSGAELTIDSGVTLTFGAQGFMLNGNTAEKKVIVDGTLVFEVYANYSEGAAATTTEVQNPQISADVAIIEGASRTYTSLANAIDMAAGEETTITLNQDVTVKDDLLIPENITVASNQYGITVGEETSTKDVTLTVEGSVQLTGADVADSIILATGEDIEGAAADQPQKYEGKLVLKGDGHVYLVTKDSSLADVAGAHYQKTVDFGTADAPDEKLVDVIATVEFAAADSASTDDISIIGENTAGDIVFLLDAEEENDTLTVTVEQNASLTVSSVTIVPGVVIDASEGYITGSVGMADVGEAYFEKATGFTVTAEHIAAVGETAAYDKVVVSGTAVKGAVQASSGTVYVDIGVTGAEKAKSSVTVASGATMVVNGLSTDQYTTVTVDGKMAIQATGSNAEVNSMTVAGTLEVTGIAPATAAGTGTIYYLSVGELTVTGTVDVGAYGDLTITGESTVTGTVNVLENGAISIEDIMTVGEQIKALEDTTTGTLALAADTCTITTGKYIKAYSGAEVTGLEGTSYYINDKLYMTVFANEDNINIMSVVYAEKFSLTEGGLALNTGLFYGDVTPNVEKNTGLFDMAEWHTTPNMLPNTILTGNETVAGDVDVYAAVAPVPANVSITVGTGLALYIDGVPYESGTHQLSVGTHQVFLNVTAGFDASEATVKFNGQTVLTGTSDTATITIGGSDSNITIVASGAVTAGSGGEIVVPAPEVTVNGDNGDMSLTDILLIILVVLIVIMAIIVALRLMRS